MRESQQPFLLPPAGQTRLMEDKEKEKEKKERRERDNRVAWCTGQRGKLAGRVDWDRKTALHGGNE